MAHADDESKEAPGAIFKKKGFWIAIAVGLLLDLAGAPFWGNLLIFFMLLMILNRFILDKSIHSFQNRALPWIMSHYERLLRLAFKGWRPVHLLLGTIALCFVSFFAFSGAISSGRVPITFFPQGDPNQIYVYLNLPVGTNVAYTDSITRILE
ncbi:efflux RND transporter permease subunit, partial|nr:efflux RND transporter permease subunit [Escherichia coli]